MGVITYEMEITSPIPPPKMFKAFVLDSDNLIPKICLRLSSVLKPLKEVEGREPSRRLLLVKVSLHYHDSSALYE